MRYTHDAPTGALLARLDELTTAQRALVAKSQRIMARLIERGIDPATGEPARGWLGEARARRRTLDRIARRGAA